MPRSSEEYRRAVQLMGKLVVVTKELRRVCMGREVDWVTTDRERRTGWVMGMRRVQVGTYSPASTTPDNWFGGEEYEPAYLEQRSNIPCLLVVFWATMRPVYVPFDGFREATKLDKPPQLPRGAPMPEKDRQWLREYMADAPRDERGRFVRAVRSVNVAPKE